MISTVSALTPSIALRSDFVRGVLPPGVPSAARILALAFGIALVWLSRSLALRRRRAWQLAVATVAAISIAHIAKGLDVEEAIAALALLVALVRYRKRFDAPGDPSASRPLAATVSVFATLGALALFLTERGTLPDPLEDTLGAFGILFGFRALRLWLRPFSVHVRQSLEERRLARRLVHEYGSDGLAFFALRRDKSYFFSPSDCAFLAYRVVAGAALVSGDPVGDEYELDELLDAFRAFAHARGWRVAILAAREAERPRYERLGLRAIKLGDEAVILPSAFSLEGRAIRKVRQSVTRLRRQGYRVRLVRSNEVDAELRRRLDEVSRAWRGRSAERGFAMAMDDLYAEPDVLFALAERADGHLGGFLHLVPTPPTGGYSLSTMRRRPGSPNGLMEFLIAETTAWAARTGSSELSLNFFVFADMLRTDCGPVALRATRATLMDSTFECGAALSARHAGISLLFNQGQPRSTGRVPTRRLRGDRRFASGSSRRRVAGRVCDADVTRHPRKPAPCEPPLGAAGAAPGNDEVDRFGRKGDRRAVQRHLEIPGSTHPQPEPWATGGERVAEGAAVDERPLVEQRAAFRADSDEDPAATSSA